MRQLARGLDAQPAAYRAFFVKKRRALLQAEREREYLPLPPPRDGEDGYARLFGRQFPNYVRYFEGLVLLVDLRDATRRVSVHSAAVPLTLENVIRVFKHRVGPQPMYGEGYDPEPTWLCPKQPLEPAASAVLEPPPASNEAGQSLRLHFTLTLYDKRTRAMATLGAGEAGYHTLNPTMGPAFPGLERQKALRGEGACFLANVPLAAWFFVGQADAEERGGGGWQLAGFGVEIAHRDVSPPILQLAEDERLMADVSQFRCLHQVFKHELLWVSE